MPFATRAWVTAARLRRKLYRRRHPILPGEERRRQWIRDHAPGRSFADIGGLHRLEGDIALAAAEAGATKVTLFDGGDQLFTSFAEKNRQRDHPVRFVQGDLEDPVAVQDIGRHDVVWCIGVIYHSPNPVRQLMHLRELTGELLYLGSHTIPEIPGVEDACVYYPGIGPESRAAYATAHEQPETLWGIGTPFDERPMLGHGNFWWGISPSALRAMLRTARFEVIEEIATHESPFFTELVARPLDEHPLLPPLSYYREYGEHRARGVEPPPFETYYQDQRDR